MNRINCTQIEYLTNSTTVETIELRSEYGRKVVYVYNYGGIRYNYFDSIQELMSFFKDEFEPTLTFDDELELDNYLESLDLTE